MARLVECDWCGALASLVTVRPVFNIGEIANLNDSARVLGIEQDIDCPDCGSRTQIILDADDCSV